jgi:hypothetical protein
MTSTSPAAIRSTRPPWRTTTCRASRSHTSTSFGKLYAVWLKTPSGSSAEWKRGLSPARPMVVASTPAAFDGLQSESWPQRIEITVVVSMSRPP